MRWTLIFLLTALLGACGEPAPPPFAKSRELVVLMREGPTTLTKEFRKKTGFEHDLVSLFAEDVGKRLKIVVVENEAKIIDKLQDGKAHLGAGWLSLPEGSKLLAGPVFFTSGDVLVQNEDALAFSSPEKLSGHALHVLSGSRQAMSARELAGQIDNLEIVEHSIGNELDLLERISRQRDVAMLVDRTVLDVASNFHPQLQHRFDIGKERSITWLFPPGTEPELLEKARIFIERVHNDGTLARLIDRYFGHVNRLNQRDIAYFIERTGTVLPDYRDDFQAAQIRTGIDWRLLAALAYQESHWDPLATSPTGVRGMMMLTEDTADQLRVSNRLDPRQSIRAGARYLADLRDALPATVKEPDRTWLALAAYNLGMGHLNGARHIARTLKKDPDSWYEMKRVLPLLAKPQYYQRLKSGKGRGGEAVIMTENIRMYYDILSRFEAPYRPFADEGIAVAREAAPGLQR